MFLLHKKMEPMQSKKKSTTPYINVEHSVTQSTNKAAPYINMNDPEVTVIFIISKLHLL